MIILKYFKCAKLSKYQRIFLQDTDIQVMNSAMEVYYQAHRGADVESALTQMGLLARRLGKRVSLVRFSW